MQHLKIVSLIASATEMVCALGLGEQLVGRSHECDYPEWVSKLPVCSEPKFHCDGKSYVIDEKVKAILSDGLSIYRVDTAQLQRLNPSHIITQDHCEVCAVSLRDLEGFCSEVTGDDVKVVSLHPNSMDDIFADIEKVASSCGCLARGEELCRTLQAELDSLSSQARHRLKTKPRVACIEWIDPLMIAGNWTPELVALAGAEDVLGVAGEHSPFVSLDSLLGQDPDIIVVMPCGFTLEQTRRELPALTKHDGFMALRAVQNGRVYLADGNRLFNRPGPRVTESLAAMIEMFSGERTAHHSAVACLFEQARFE